MTGGPVHWVEFFKMLALVVIAVAALAIAIHTNAFNF